MHGPLTMCKACPACKFYCDQDSTKGGSWIFWTSQSLASALKLAWGNSRVRIVPRVTVSLTLSVEHFLGAEVRWCVHCWQVTSCRQDIQLGRGGKVAMDWRLGFGEREKEGGFACTTALSHAAAFFFIPRICNLSFLINSKHLSGGKSQFS